MSSVETTDADEGPGRARRWSLPSMPASSAPVVTPPPSLATIKTAAMFSAAKRLVQVKETLGEFHKKGGFVGWLHGDEAEPSVVEQAKEEEEEDDDAGDSFALAYSPTNPKKEAVDALTLAVSNLWGVKSSDSPENPRPSSPSTRELILAIPDAAERGNEEDEDDGLHTPPTPRSASGSPEKGPRSMARSERASVFESMYDKVLKASTPRTSNSSSSSSRVSLQPSSRRKASGRAVDALASGFDDFVGVDSSPRRSKFFGERVTRQRADSEPLWRSTARQPPATPAPLLSRVGKAKSAPIRVLQAPTESEDVGALTLDDYLADPKLAAEFVSAALPGDGALLVLLYAVEEFDALATLPIASEQADATARTLLDSLRSLRDRPDGAQQRSSANAGPRTLAALSQLTFPTTKDMETLVQTAQLEGGGLALTPTVTTLFRAVHAAVYAELDAAFAQQFTYSSEYDRLVAHRQRELQMARQRDSTLLLVSALLEDEWTSTVLWAFLFRVSRHQLLSLLMDVRFRLEPLFAACLDAASGEEQQFRALAALLDAFVSKFLLKTSPVQLPTASIELARLKAAAVTRIARLNASSSASSGSGEALRARATSAIEGVRSLMNAVASEFASTEKLAAFSASALFREFVAAPSASRGDVVRLFRAARVPFHQAPRRMARPSDLLVEYVATRQLQATGSGDDIASYSGNALIYRILAFERREGDAEGSSHTTFVDLMKRCSDRELEGEAMVNASGDDSTLLRTIESFLAPEVASNTARLDEHCANRRLAFHFVAGAGDDALYGAAIRVPMRLHAVSQDGETATEVAAQGVCILSRAPLVDSLRQFVHAFWRELGISTSDTETAASLSERIADADSNRVRDALTAAWTAFDAFVSERHGSLASRETVAAQGTSDCEQGDDCALSTLDTQLRELFDSLSVSNVVRAFGSLVAEKKLVLVASSFSLLVAVGEALRALLSPLAWAHVFAPVLPLSLRGYLQCPAPFLFGLHASYFHDCELPSDVVVVDLDRDLVTCSEGFEDTDAALSGLRDKLLALCRPQTFTRDSIEYGDRDSNVHRTFPDREVRLSFRQQLESMLATLEAAAFRFKAPGGNAALTNAVVAVMDAPPGENQDPRRGESPEMRVLAALRQSQAFSAHVCRPKV